MVWFCYLAVFISTLLFQRTTFFLPVFVVKNNAVQYHSNVTWCLIRVTLYSFSVSWGGAASPPHQLGGLGERCKLPEKF